MGRAARTTRAAAGRWRFGARGDSICADMHRHGCRHREDEVSQHRPSRRTLDPAATRQRILAAAEELYLERGIAATTLSAVASRAGVSRPTVYKHVGDGDRLATVVIDGELDTYFERVAEVLARHGDVREQLVEMLAFTVEYAAGHRLLQRQLELDAAAVLATFTTAAGSVLQRAIRLLEPPLMAAIERGEIRATATDVVAEWVARMALSLVLTPSVTRDLSDPIQLRDYLTTLLVEGPLVRPEP
jgi:AcrR family transcriptional regulator